MQFRIYSIGDVTRDLTNGNTPTEAIRIQAMVQIAVKAKEIGLDVFASGEHHNPPFVTPAPPVALAYIAAQTKRTSCRYATSLKPLPSQQSGRQKIAIPRYRGCLTWVPG